MTFDRFEIGMELGEKKVLVAPLLADWEALFPSPRDVPGLPVGLLVSIMMRGYLAILDRRPMGNVHAGQRLRFGPPTSGGELNVAVRCTAKERRGDRPWLTFGTTVSGMDRIVYLEGEMRSLWAA